MDLWLTTSTPCQAAQGQDEGRVGCQAHLPDPVIWVAVIWSQWLPISSPISSCRWKEYVGYIAASPTIWESTEERSCE